MTHSRSPRDVTRRGFLSDVAVGATGALALSALLPGESHASTEEPIAPEAEWDLTWIDRLTGKYRTVFDAPEINDGTVFTNATVFMMGFGEVYKATDADMQAVLVLRHNAVPLVFNDAMWEKYGIGTDLKIAGAEKKNPWTGEMATLQKRGAIFLGCSLAANRRAREIARRVGANADAVRADLYANLLPGVIMQQSGVFATIRAQQAGCSFMKSG
ncbi:MAG TPA: twin-arginine translocation signal domain-containing protein [Gemmatimonadaceae bacterium]|nr:twin-arginine translocation signal domain-containing protein [Gemmatimonadaceae bacterium]